ncbi:hypothetical protein Tco_0678130 [Tanacetum coccineum]|uniref:Uncharacterized protein n=1 Tax=Tanacetum coccineum TaxID=301880 RepID=A0ABQ4XE49_9ASTR
MGMSSWWMTVTIHEDDVPYDLADSDNEVLTNSDDDKVATVVYSSDKEDDLIFCCRGPGAQKGRAMGGSDGGMKGVCKAKKNIKLKKAFNNFVGELVREFSMHYPSGYDIVETKKAHIQGRPTRHRRGPRWDIITEGIDAYFAKRYDDNKYNM